MPALIYPALCWLAIHLGGAWTWIGLPFNLILVPALDHGLRWIAGSTWKLPPRAALFLYNRAWIWAAAVAHLGVLYWALGSISADTSTLALLGLVSTVGISGGCLAITAAHELIHRRSQIDRLLGMGLLGSVLYMHFRIEHVYGHHRHVGTEDDLATAKPGESFFAFFNRTLARGWVSAWRLEGTRLQRRRKPPVSVNNRMIWFAASQTLTIAAIAWHFGGLAVIAFVLQAFVAVHLLEATNYVQHYGLTRHPDTDGALQRATAKHCWDSEYVVSSALLFNLPMHGQHHDDPTIPCQDLAPSEKANSLPASFYLMVFLALIPPLWHTLMDARIAPRALPGVGAATNKGF